MITGSRNDLGKLLKQRRVMSPMTLQELGGVAGVSPSHIARIENGKRFPSARILRRLAKPLDLDETALLTLAEYMSPQYCSDSCEQPGRSRLDPYVAVVLSGEPIELQRAIVGLLRITMRVAKILCTHEERNVGKRSTIDNPESMFRSCNDGTE